MLQNVNKHVRKIKKHTIKYDETVYLLLFLY